LKTILETRLNSVITAESLALQSGEEVRLAGRSTYHV
jgi:hypothetical protein